MYMLEIRLDGLPKRTNNNKGSWRARAGEAKKWKLRVHREIFFKRLAPIAPLKKAKLILIRRSSKAPDYDGLVSSFKHIIDGLVECGVIDNDKMDNIGVPEYRWESAKQNNGHVVIRVEEIR